MARPLFAEISSSTPIEIAVYCLSITCLLLLLNCRVGRKPISTPLFGPVFFLFFFFFVAKKKKDGKKRFVFIVRVLRFQQLRTQYSVASLTRFLALRNGVWIQDLFALNSSVYLCLTNMAVMHWINLDAGASMYDSANWITYAIDGLGNANGTTLTGPQYIHRGFRPPNSTFVFWNFQGKLVRFDTSKPFATASSWQVVNLDSMFPNYGTMRER